MTILRTVRVAAVQATPVVFDADACVDKAIDLIETAARQGAELVVMPECFVSLYPSWAFSGPALTDGKAMDELFVRFWESSIEVPGPHVDRIAEACGSLGVHCVISVNEREPSRSRSVYNSMLTFGPQGLMNKHRKLMPTFHERLFHTFGNGDDLAVLDTPLGRVGGLMCWENRMPLARYAVYRGAPQIYVAPTADDSDGWQALMRTVAIESGAFVISAIQYMTRDRYPDDFPVTLPEGRDTVSRGGTCIIDCSGNYLAEPLYGEEGILYAECDLRSALPNKNWFDVAGHYSREDVLLPLLTSTKPNPSINS